MRCASRLAISLPMQPSQPAWRGSWRCRARHRCHRSRERRSRLGLRYAALPVIHDFPVTLSLCPRLGIANAPPGDRSLHIIGYTARARVNAVTLARAPVERACVSSGFGNRNGQAHTGIDLYNRDPVAIYAAGDGVIREAHYRDDYGNMLVIDHGRGVFTRYAHLASPTDFSEGDTVTSGQIIGVMGNTASHLIPRHLHYEILTGTWGHQAGSFALKPVNPLKPEDEIE